MSTVNKHKKLFISMVLAFLFNPGQPRAQSANSTFFAPNIFPNAPNTAAFAKFGSYPVSMYSGVPDISIPLYTIEAGGLSVPITLSYHASGIRVSDAASWAGLGWSVNCGGSITRQVMGLPDEKGYLLERKISLSNFDLKIKADADYARETVEDQYHDNLPDMYAYQIPGYRGKFFYDADSSFKIMNVPRTPLLIAGSFNGAVNSFDITDDHGNNYTLGKNCREITGAPGSGGLIGTTAISAWMLEQMVSQNRRDTVSFTYSPSYFQLPDGMTESISIEDDVQDLTQANYGANTSPQTVLVNNPSTVTEQQLRTIYFKNGKADFITGKTGRLDLGSQPGSTVYPLDTIKVSKYNYITKSYEPQKSIVFLKSYFTNGLAKRLRLDGIQVLDGAGNIVEHYSFAYNTAVNLPAYGSLARDYWGYYNGQDNSTDLIPQTTIQMITNGVGLSTINIGNPNDPTSSCRNIDTTKMQACMLTSITYPTGGYTDFTYQTNRYFDAESNMVLAGGLRIKTISSYDGLVPAVPVVKTYQYDAASANYISDGSDNLNYGLFTNTQTYRDWILLSNADDPESIGGYDMIATKRVRRFFAQPTIDLAPDGVPVAYTRVTEYTGTPAANAGKSTSAFSYTPTSLQGGGGETGVYLPYDFSFSNGLLLNKTDYQKKPDGTFQMVKSESNNYGAWGSYYYDEVGVAMGQRCYNDGVLMGANAYYGIATPDDEQTYPLGDFAVESGDINLTSTTTSVYDISDTSKFTTSSVAYHYDDPIHQQVAAVTSTDSKGDTLVTVNKHPYDYQAGNAVIDTMVSQHIWADAIEKWDTLKNAVNPAGAVTGAQLNRFQFGIMGGAVLPASISTLSLSGPVTDFKPSAVDTGTLTGDPRYQQMISFDLYDSNNNIAQYTPRNSTPVSVIWDYQQSLPIAQVKNASVADIAYTGFEADGYGNWYYNGKPVADASAPTGGMCYPLSSGNISSPYLNTAISYLLSYWGKGGPATVTAGYSTLTGTATQTANGWTCYNYQVPAGTGQVVLSGALPVDELRLYPAGAQMSTYAYGTAGLQTTSDAKGENTRYEYDDFQRLLNVKDKNGSIIKNYCYTYTGQAGGCPIKTALPVYYNNADSAAFTRSTCNSGYTGSTVPYVVPAGKYTSMVSQQIADSLAVADASANGQAYADSTGTCTLLVYYNSADSVSFTRDNCDSGLTGSTVTYVVPAGKYTSALSQKDADGQARFDAKINGQAYADSVGTCTLVIAYYNAADSASFTRGNCGIDSTGSVVTYRVPAGTYNSTVSQADADSLAINDVNTNGQAYANANAACAPVQYISFSLSNGTGEDYQAAFSGTGQDLIFNMTAQRDTTILVPAGTYSLVIYTNGTYVSRTFTLGARTPVSGVPRTDFDDVDVATGSSDLTLSVE